MKPGIVVGMSAPTYTEDEVQAIFRQAVEQHSQQTALGRDDLISIAEDMGIPAQAVHNAILEVERDRVVSKELTRLNRSRRHSLGSAVATWAIVNAGLFGLCAATGGRFWIACYWTVGVWGTIILLKAQHALFPSLDKDRLKAEKTLRKRKATAQLEEARQRTILEREARRARPRSSSGRRDVLGQLDTIIEQGVSDLLQGAARKMGISLPDSNRQTSSPKQPSTKSSDGPANAANKS